MKLTPIGEFVWPDGFSEMYGLTCIHHTTARYITKNPYYRSIHLLRIPEGDIERIHTGECTCPVSDLAVIED